MFEALIIGVIQGIAEWIPISSEAAIIFVKNTFFKTDLLFEELVKEALFLHLGTFLAALIYFRKDIKELTIGLSNFQDTSPENKKTIIFLILSTVLSGLFGFAIIKAVSEFQTDLELGSRFINILVAILLAITALLQIKTKKISGVKLRMQENLNTLDGIILGLAQGLAVLPGLSRSGLTVSTLLLRKFDDTVSLKLSFLMSLPIVLLGNVILNFQSLHLSVNSLISLFSAFILGLLTIDLLIKFSRKVNFGYFVLFFAVLVLFSAFL